jgi:Helitron helicase-like domain at N-terminus/PIF1-like helicase
MVPFAHPGVRPPASPLYRPQCKPAFGFLTLISLFDTIDAATLPTCCLPRCLIVPQALPEVRYYTHMPHKDLDTASDFFLARSPSLGSNVLSSTCITSETKQDDVKPISNCIPSIVPNPRYLQLKASTREGLYSLLKTLSIGILRVWAIEYSIPPNGPRNVKSSFLDPFIEHFISTIHTLESSSAPELSSLLEPTTSPLPESVPGLQYHYLLQKFPKQFLQRVMYVRMLNKVQLCRSQRAVSHAATINAKIEHRQTIFDSWPQVIESEQIQEYCTAYLKATTISVPRPCVCCGRSFFAELLSKSFSFSLDDRSLPDGHQLLILRADTSFAQDFVAPFSLLTPILDGIMLFHAYIDVSLPDRKLNLETCVECSSSLSRQCIPKFSLRNNLYRGVLPDDLKDITWIEEKVCALHRVSADVARLFNAEHDESLPYRLVGNTCAYPTNVPSTARILPRLPADVNGSLTVVFVGSSFNANKLPPLFRVRRRIIQRFLNFLAANNPLYADVPISEEILAQYPEDGILPLLEESVVFTHAGPNSSILAQETATFDDHLTASNPSNSMFSSDLNSATTPEHVIESTGVIDFDGTSFSGLSATATAMFNLVTSFEEQNRPNLVLPRAREFVKDYDNPDLMPGMFPTLFPNGRGGLEASRPINISFQEHTNYLLSLHDTSFKHHRLFMFVALSIIKRRRGHLFTSFSVKKPGFAKVASEMSSVSTETLESTARHLQNNGRITDLSSDQLRAYNCLKQLNIVTGHIPGSPAAKMIDRSSILSYFGLFGLPHIFTTLNYSPLHSPIFQIFIGNKEIDLASRFPKMPFPRDKAKLLAANPVAAADFFVFCMRMFFKHLLGYDMDSKESKGGVLGHVLAHYGKAECTMRAVLHGHHCIWLLGGLNPSDVHHKLENDAGFSERFFAFWEQVIKHDKPISDLEISPSFEPRSERPLPLDGSGWETDFNEDVSACAESLQRHRCQEVCWKYRNVSHLPIPQRPCRFEFPHEIVDHSHYDASSKSIFMKCLDPTINYYNPYILAMCRHNHDMKCILSGKSARASMFYITNYITKDDLHSHHILSMMSSTIAHMKEDENASPIDRAKARLQRWVSSLARLQEIHAQQAVLYIRGVGDSFFSHETTPMLSSHLLAAVRKFFPETMASDRPDVMMSGVTDISPEARVVDRDCDAEEQSLDEVEQPSIQIFRTPDGTLHQTPTHIDDYLHRDQKLNHLNFYQFICCVRKERISQQTPTRLGSYTRFEILLPHPQASSHCLVLHQDPLLPWHMWKLAPRVIGMTVPRKQRSDYHIFMLAHFKPFSASNPLISPFRSYKEVCESFEFSEFSKRIMKNWEDVHECEDERDAERICRRQRDGKTNAEMNATLAKLEEMDSEDDPSFLVDIDSSPTPTPRRILQIVDVLKEGGWFAATPEKDLHEGPQDPISTPVQQPDRLGIKRWDAELKLQESNIKRERLNRGDSRTQMDYQTSSNLPEAMTGDEAFTKTEPTNPVEAPETVMLSNSPRFETADALIRKLGEDATLNSQQWKAYLIVARKFVENENLRRQGLELDTPLRLLLTGPGGTGKSHVVNTLRRLMAAYGVDHKLRLLAPTGSAAQGIGASTIHKSLGIQVIKRGGSKGFDPDDYVGQMSKKKQADLEAEWKDAEYIFCDEMSLIGAELIAQIDQVLRLVKDNNEWFGNVNMIFSGDFAQYKPVAAQPLYEAITRYSGSKTKRDMMNRFGRMAWKSINAVVELKEQMRMCGDLEYGETVARLRLRKCTEQDVELFNSRILRSPSHPDGVVLSPHESVNATMIVADNKLRLFLNELKANALIPKTQLVLCAARDTNADGSPLAFEEQKKHINHNFASATGKSTLPSTIPLAVGMKIVLRQRNISPELNISNGSPGIVHSLFTSPYNGYTCADGAVVYFPTSPLQLQGLPRGCAYIQPMAVSYHIMENGSKRSFQRRQLPIEPAFAVTGHFAQGKTIPIVVANLKQPDPAATYVIASRATSRHGLFLTEEVTLGDLNRSMPRSLRKELMRLSALEHNTYIAHGFLNSKPVPVPDEEELDASEPSQAKLRWELKAPTKKPQELAPKMDESNITDKSQAVGTHRRVMTDQLGPGLRRNETHRYPFPFLRWDSANWSCAYDSLLTPLFAIWYQASEAGKAAIATSSHYLSNICASFLLVTRSHDGKEALFYQAREQLRNALSSGDLAIFPRTGAIGTPLVNVLEELGLLEPLRCKLRHECSSLYETTFAWKGLFYGLTVECLGSNPAPRTTVQDWFDAQLQNWNGRRRTCPTCHRLIDTIHYEIDRAPPIIVIESNSEGRFASQIIPSWYLTPRGQATVTYRLSAILYLGGGHYTARVFFPAAGEQNGQLVAWSYDGIIGAPQIEHMVGHDTARLLSLANRPSCFFLYALQL